MDFNLQRRVEPELLDGLAAEDPQAQRSRKDLRRIHRAMATLLIVQRALDRGTAGFIPRTLLELGAGDGSLMLRLARKRADRWPGVNVTLLDRLHLVEPLTLEEIHKLGWTPRVLAVDIFNWLEGHDDSRTDVVFANLFMHHFSSTELARLLVGIAARSRVFLCCEPRRSALLSGGKPLHRLAGCRSGDAAGCGIERARGIPGARVVGTVAQSAGLDIARIFSRLVQPLFPRRTERTQMNTNYDVIIVGGGPSGATAAVLLAQAGWKVAVVEKAKFPRRKVCGEFISGTTWPLLRQLGIADPLMEIAGPVVRRVGVYAGDAMVTASLAAPTDSAERRRQSSRSRTSGLTAA